MKPFALLSFTFLALQTEAADPEFETMLDDLLDGNVGQITTEQLAAKSGKFLLLDSRSREEYDISHLKGAHWVGFDKFDAENFDKIDRDTPLVVYCSVGKRSEIVGEKLEKAGFKNVANVRGGIFQWANEKRPLVDAAGPTKNVHPFSRKWGKWLKPHVPRKN